MAEALHAPQGLRVPKFRLENDASLQSLHDPGLPGHAEFFLQIAADMGDGPNGILAHKPSPLSVDSAHRETAFTRMCSRMLLQMVPVFS